MFENLTDRLNGVFDKLSRRGKLSERDVDAAMREVRLALLEADVNYRVVKKFIEDIRSRAVGQSHHLAVPAIVHRLPRAGARIQQLSVC